MVNHTKIPLSDNLRDNLRQARKTRGLNQDTVGSAMGFSRPTISMIEGGYRAFITMAELEKFARLYEVSVQMLLEGRLMPLIEDNPKGFFVSIDETEYKILNELRGGRFGVALSLIGDMAKERRER